MTVHLPPSNNSQPTAFRSPAIVKAEGDMAPSEDPRPMVVASLRRLLADVVTFYLRAHGYHWNVVGSDFTEYHALFEMIYSDTFASVDPIAENIRKMDGVAPFRLPEIMALRSIVDTPISAPLPSVMTADLYAGNDMILACLNDAFAIASAANEQGIANFIAERIDAHQKFAWQLKASLAGA